MSESDQTNSDPSLEFGEADDKDAEEAKAAEQEEGIGQDSVNDGEMVDDGEMIEPEPSQPAPPKPPPKDPRAAGTSPSARPLPPPASTRRPGTTRELPPRKFPPETVCDIMSRKVVALQANDSLENIEEGMARYRIRHMPVVDDSNKLVGLLTHRDLMHGLSSSLSEQREKRDELIRAHAKVSALMKVDVVAVRPEEPVSAVGMLLWEKKIGCVPVTDEDGCLLGITTKADFVRLCVALLDEEEVPPLSSPTPPIISDGGRRA